MGEWQGEKNGINGRVTGWEKWDKWESDRMRKVGWMGVPGREKSDKLESDRVRKVGWIGEC